MGFEQDADSLAALFVWGSPFPRETQKVFGGGSLVIPSRGTADQSLRSSLPVAATETPPDGLPLPFE